MSASEVSGTTTPPSRARLVKIGVPALLVSGEGDAVVLAVEGHALRHWCDRRPGRQHAPEAASCRTVRRRRPCRCNRCLRVTGLAAAGMRGCAAVVAVITASTGSAGRKARFRAAMAVTVQIQSGGRERTLAALPVARVLRARIVVIAHDCRKRDAAALSTLGARARHLRYRNPDRRCTPRATRRPRRWCRCWCEPHRKGQTLPPNPASAQAYWELQEHTP